MPTRNRVFNAVIATAAGPCKGGRMALYRTPYHTWVRARCRWGQWPLRCRISGFRPR